MVGSRGRAAQCARSISGLGLSHAGKHRSAMAPVLTPPRALPESVVSCVCVQSPPSGSGGETGLGGGGGGDCFVNIMIPR